MADLIPMTETAEWVAQIHQRPAGEPLTGGSPDLGNDKGFANVQAQQLAKRTKWLQQALTGIGGDAPMTDNLDTLAKSGVYFGSGDAVGTPWLGLDMKLLHIHTGEEAVQIGVPGPGKLAFRDRDDPALPFSPWSYCLAGETKPALSVGGNGYVLLPNGLILQWGRSDVSNSTGYAQATFPISFPNATRQVYGTAHGVPENGASAVYAVSALMEGFKGGIAFRVANISDGSLASGKSVTYFAIGH